SADGGRDRRVVEEIPDHDAVADGGVVPADGGLQGGGSGGIEAAAGGRRSAGGGSGEADEAETSAGGIDQRIRADGEHDIFDDVADRGGGGDGKEGGDRACDRELDGVCGGRKREGGGGGGGGGGVGGREGGGGGGWGA